MSKKYQIFISSTNKDLKDERSKAIKAVLEAGHIPAGMEQFGGEGIPPIEVIKRWIDDSDIYALILGGKYGTLEEKSHYGYTELEYDYALEKDKPRFFIILSEDYLKKRQRRLQRKMFLNRKIQDFMMNSKRRLN